MRRVVNRSACMQNVAIYSTSQSSRMVEKTKDITLLHLCGARSNKYLHLFNSSSTGHLYAQNKLKEVVKSTYTIYAVISCTFTQKCCKKNHLFKR